MEPPPEELPPSCLASRFCCSMRLRAPGVSCLPSARTCPGESGSPPSLLSCWDCDLPKAPAGSQPGPGLHLGPWAGWPHTSPAGQLQLPWKCGEDACRTGSPPLRATTSGSRPPLLARHLPRWADVSHGEGKARERPGVQIPNPETGQQAAALRGGAGVGGGGQVTRKAKKSRTNRGIQG